MARLLAPTYKPVTTDAGFDTIESWECPAIIGADLIPTLRHDLQALERFLASGCPADASRVCLGQLAALTKSRGDLTAQSVAIKVNAMAAMLSGYPQMLVEKACRAYALESIFFPALAELVAHIRPELAAYERQKSALQTMLTKAEKDAAGSEKARADEPEEVREAGRNLSAALARKLAGRASPEDLEMINAFNRSKGYRPLPSNTGDAA